MGDYDFVRRLSFFLYAALRRRASLGYALMCAPSLAYHRALPKEKNPALTFSFNAG